MDHIFHIVIGQSVIQRNTHHLVVIFLRIGAQSLLISQLLIIGMPVDRQVMHLRAGILRIQSIEKLPSVAVQVLQIQMQHIQMPGRVRLRDLLLQDQFRHFAEHFIITLTDFLSTLFKCRELLQLAQ